MASYTRAKKVGSTSNEATCTYVGSHAVPRASPLPRLCASYFATLCPYKMEASVPPAGLPQYMAPYQRTKLHPPNSSQVLPVGCQSQVVISSTYVHITCISDVYVAWLRSCQSPSGWHHTWYSQKRPAETPSTNSQLQTTHSPQSQHA